MNDEDKQKTAADILHEDSLDGDKIREWFNSRDPDRKKADPFLDEDAQRVYTGKASSLTRVAASDEQDGKEWGVSYTEHQRHLKETSRNYSWIGFNGGLVLAIVLAIVMKIFVI